MTGFAQYLSAVNSPDYLVLKVDFFAGFFGHLLVRESADGTVAFSA